MKTKIDNIKFLYQKLGHKTNFIKDVANALNKAPATLRNHWFGAFWSIPEKYQDKIIEMLQKQIRFDTLNKK